MAGYTTFFKALKFGCLYVNFLVVQIQYFWWVKGGWNMMCVRGEVWIDRTIGMRGLLLGLDGMAKVLGGLLLGSGDLNLSPVRIFNGNMIRHPHKCPKKDILTSVPRNRASSLASSPQAFQTCRTLQLFFECYPFSMFELLLYSL
ncbi:hypothetical protein R6Q59_006152 [Mikania micrantha]